MKKEKKIKNSLLARILADHSSPGLLFTETRAVQREAALKSSKPLHPCPEL